MTRILTIARLRAFAPIAIYAVIILVLMISSLFAVVDLVGMRSSLASERDVLKRMQDRATQHDGAKRLDPNMYLVEASSQGVAAAELQRLVSDVFGRSGADLQLKDLMPSDPEGDVGRLAIAVNFEIDEDRLPGLLFALENTKPALMAERISVRVVTGSTATRRLQCTMTIVAAWRPRT